MTPKKRPSAASAKVTAIVRRRIMSGGDRIWRIADFHGKPYMTVAQALSRLVRQGHLQRYGKGLYYLSQPGESGPSTPDPAKLLALLDPQTKLYPAGLTAAKLLDFTSRTPKQIELATDSISVPRQLVGKETIIHTQRPKAWRSLSQTDAALLDFLRRRGETSDLSPDETVRKLLGHFAEEGRLERLLRVIATEPPRVRAMLGAIGEQIGWPKARLRKARKGLNPESHYEFGVLAALEYSVEWLAREPQVSQKSKVRKK